MAALEAERADYRAVLAAINALGANQRDHGEQLRAASGKQDAMTQQQSDIHVRVRSIEDNLAEVKDLLVRALDR